MRLKSSHQESEIIIQNNQELTQMPRNVSNSPIYLDLSYNQIKDLETESDFNSLISLNLNSNPISRLDSITFLNLRSLTLDFCNLNSMKKMPQLPNLIYLSLIGNNLSSFEYFRIFPNLSRINLRGNSVSFDIIHTIATIGSLRLSTIDNHQITEEEFTTAFSLSPIVGHALRRGRELLAQSDETTASLSFLSKEPPLDVKNIGGCLVIRCPVEGTSNFRWYQSSSTESEWELLDCTARTLPVTPMMHLHLIKCEYGDKSFYTPDVIQRDSNDCFISFVTRPDIIGVGNINSILSLNNRQNFPTKINWRYANSSSIGTCSVLIVPPEARGQRLIAEVFPFSPVFQQVKFAPITTEIQISNVQEIELIRLSIPDSIVENEQFDIDYETYPDNAKLKFTIDVSDSFESQYTTIANLNNETQFTPSADIAGKFIRVTTFVADRQYCAYSKNRVSKVQATLKRSLIVGENKTNHPHVYLFEFTDNVESKSTKQDWFVTDGINKEFLSKNSIFIPNDDCSGLTLGVDVHVCFNHTENESDKYRKEQTFTILQERPLEKARIVTNSVEVEAIEDSQIMMNTKGEWERTDVESPTGLQSIEVNEIYTPQFSDIFKYLRFHNKTTDIILRPVLPSQSPIRSILLTFNESELKVGMIIHADLQLASEKNVDGDVQINWLRLIKNETKVVQIGGFDYITSHDDLGSRIQVRVESENWQKSSQSTPTVKKCEFNQPLIQGTVAVGETLTINTKCQSIRWFHLNEPICLYEGPTFSVKFIDVNHRIRVCVNDNYNELTDSVSSICVEEGQVIKFSEVFHRELTNKTGVLWFRYIFDEQEWREISDHKNYRLCKEDVNSVIRVVSYRIHHDGSKTSELFADIGSIVSNPQFEEEEEEEEEEIVEAKLEFTKHGQLVIIGEFQDDDPSLKFFWRRWHGDTYDEIKGSSEKKLTPYEGLIGCDIDAGYKTDSNPYIIWTNKVHIDHAMPAPVATLIESGPLVPGCKLEIKTNQVYHSTTKKKPKKRSINDFDDDDESDDEETLKLKLKWKRWDGVAFTRIKTADSNVYTITEEDTNCYVCCDVYFVDNDNNHGPNTSVETSSPVSSDSVGIEGETIVCELLQVDGVDDFITNCHFQWQRCISTEVDEDEDDNWITVGKKRTYRCCCDDVGLLIRVVCTSHKEKRISNPVGPIEMNKELDAKVKQILKNGVFRFKGKDQKQGLYSFEVNVNQFGLKTKNQSKTVLWKSVDIKDSLSSTKKIDIFVGSTARLTVEPLLTENGNNGDDVGMDRELCILILRAFKEKAMQNLMKKK